MKKITLGLILLTLSLQTFQAFGQEEINSADLKIQLALTHLMSEVADSVDHQLSREKNPFWEEKRLVSIIQNEAKKFEEIYIKSTLIPTEQVPVFRKFLLTMRWENIIQLMKRSYLGVDVFFKRKGYGFSIAFMLGKVFQVGFAYFCMHNHLEALAPIIMSTPLTIFATTIPVKLQKYKIESEIKEVLGGADQLRAYREQENKLMEVLALSSEKEMLLPFDEIGLAKAVVLSENSMTKKLTSLLGMISEKVTLINVKDFLRENKIESDYYKWILKNTSLDDDSKTAIIVLSILENEEHRSLFQIQFHSQIRTFHSNNNWDEIVQWTKKMKEITDVEELIKAFRNIPKNISSRDAAIIWSDVLFPTYVEKLNLDYSEARQLIYKGDSLKARLLALKDNADIEKEMLAFLGEILSDTKGSRCQTPASVIKESLLLDL